MVGPEVVLFPSMQGMICKLPERHGWPAGPRPASVVVAELSRLVPVDALSEFVSWDGPSVSLLVHVDFADTLLKASGKRGIFIKAKEGAGMDLLWLSEETDLAQAVKLAEGDEVFGVVEKGGSVNPSYTEGFFWIGWL